MKRAILVVSAALFLFAGAPAQADGYRSKQHGSGHYAYQGKHAKPHYGYKRHDFGVRRHGRYVKPRHFRGYVQRPYATPYRFKPRYYGWTGHRPHFRPYAGRGFKRRHFGGHRYGYRW